jgi:hypothetical protein
VASGYWGLLQEWKEESQATVSFWRILTRLFARPRILTPESYFRDGSLLGGGVILS